MSNKKRKFLEDFEETLEEHFEELQREAEPIATRYVREVTGEATLRDGEDGLIYLPPFFTVRKCYAQYCYQKRGVIITTSNKGNVRAAPAVDGEELNSFPSWKGYWTYWRDHYPNLKVRKPTRDICNFCYKFYNMHKFGPVESTSVAEGEDPTTIEEGVIETEDEDVHRELLAETDADLNAPVAVTTLAREREIAILDAVLHVKKAMAMRALVNSKIETSKKHRVQNVPHSDRVYTIIADFCQNMELPHFGQQQPGETYFLTPVKLEGFGVADVSYEWKDGKETDHLYFHCFVEGHGAKGGSNVASMIVKTLRKTKIMRDDDNGAPVRGKELNIVMDNCAGQNKNNYVLLLAPYLVEAGYFFTVNMLFLIAGHTKNVCDRRFNDLKRDYHKSQVFTIDDAVEVFNASEYVTVCQIDPENDWKNYADFLQQPYVLLAKANLSIVNNHIFCAEWTPSTDPLATSSGGSLTFYTRESALEEHVRKYGVITKATFAAGGNRTETLRSMAPESINYKGLPGYKQILMYNSFREYLVWAVQTPFNIIAATFEEQPSRKTVEKHVFGSSQKRLDGGPEHTVGLGPSPFLRDYMERTTSFPFTIIAATLCRIEEQPSRKTVEKHVFGSSQKRLDGGPEHTVGLGPSPFLRDYMERTTSFPFTIIAAILCRIEEQPSRKTVEKHVYGSSQKRLDGGPEHTVGLGPSPFLRDYM
ncbi:hypothetical protein IV203_032418 [Nitzschia inconspicua]|uniref:DUF7869 domain-containing protein n=1 Tax=Nitzschia inconspicua TaxID=303405 RepID=A0A9K3KJN8_9STRA|nr:hypothetical protein IV203_032418 [Nitzschia inconspicua]